MKRRRVLYSIAAVALAAGTILTGSIVSAQAVPARLAEAPTTYSALFGTAGADAFLCAFEGEVTLSDHAATSPPPEMRDHPGKVVDPLPGDFVTSEDFAGPAPEGVDVEIDPSTVNPGTPEQCEKARADVMEATPTSPSKGGS